MTGGSTGGWETLGVQVMYPDDYNGAWALCPDPVDFRAYRSVNIYDEHNAYYYEDNPWKHTLKPGYRDSRRPSVLDVHGSQPGRARASAARTDAPAASTTRGSRSSDRSATTGTSNRSSIGITGQIDPTVAQYWKDHYDLRNIMERDWAKLGPEAQGEDPHHQRRRWTTAT